MNSTKCRAGRRCMSMTCIAVGMFAANIAWAMGQNSDLVVTIDGDQPAYTVENPERVKATISSSDPDTATSVEKVVEQPVADRPFEDIAMCQCDLLDTSPP